MSEHEATPSDLQSPLKLNSFLLRRLHSLSGIIPVGLFVCMHLFTNFQLLVGDFQHEVEFIHALPALLILEVTIWVSIGFHAALGLVYTFQGKSNTNRYPYMDNWRYTLQRITGMLALLFIFFHVSTLRWRWTYFGIIDTPFFVAGPNGEPLVAATTAAALQHSYLVLVVYIIGVASVVYHWCNGLWTAAISWGLTVSVPAQKRWGYVCFTLALVLTVFSAGAIVAACTRDISDMERQAIQATSELHQAGMPLREKASGSHEPYILEVLPKTPAGE